MDFSLNATATPTDRALGRAYLDFGENFTRLEAFRIVATAGIEAGLPAVEAILRDQIDDILRRSSAAGVATDQLEAAISDAIRVRKRADTELAIHSATVVFAHAILERLLHDLMLILAEHAAASVAACAADRKVRLGDLRMTPAATLEARAANEYIEDLMRQPFRKKIAFFFDICGFLPSCQSDFYRYDQDRLLQIDTDRQDLLHQRLFAASHAAQPPDLQFVQYTGFFFLCLVVSHLKAKIDLWQAIEPLLSKPPDPTANS